MNTKIKWILFLIFVLAVIFSVFTYFFIEKEFIFAKYTKATYADGCIEEYKNGVAITPLCVNSRAKGIGVAYYG